MRYLLSTFFVSLLSICGCGSQGSESSTAAEVPSVPRAEDGYVGFPDIGHSMVQPSGFEIATGFEGFQQQANGASVMITAMPAPYSEFEKGFTGEALQTRGMHMLDRQEVTIAGKPGILIKANQNAQGIEFEKWLGVFGDQKQTHIVTASYPKELSGQFSDTLKSTILTILPGLAEGNVAKSGPGFELTPASDLKPGPVMGKMLSYTRDGVMPIRSPGDPLFVAAPSLGNPPITEEGSFAMVRLREIVNTQVNMTRSHDQVTIDGLSGYETVADGMETTSGTPLLVYQVVLFDKDKYYLIQGLVGAGEGAQYLPHFQSMAHSFKRE